ncbi:MAG: hypothetical protein M3430_03575 [Acidobacteriota bacterium]|nr:hypothetical protein [Acidobacteriota bacterium]
MMQFQLARRAVMAAMAFAVVCLCCVPDDVQAQRRRNRQSRRVTNPVRTQRAPRPTPPVSTQNLPDPAVVSTSEESAAESVNPQNRATTSRTTRANRTSENDSETLRRTVNELSGQVTKLSEDLGQMREQQRALVNLERLTRAEQRAESLRSQLRDVTDKEFALQERAAQIEDELRSENIERRAALIGTLRPAELREQIQRTLERERERVRAQVQLLTTSRTRLEGAVGSADTEVERIRALIDADDRAASERSARAGSTIEETPVSSSPATPSTATQPTNEPDNPPQ